jgi:hypothetical protein
MLQRRLHLLVFMVTLGIVPILALGAGSGQTRSDVRPAAGISEATQSQADAFAVTHSPTLTFQVFLPALARWVEPDNKSWWMAGANPQRTSRTEEEVRGRLHPEWYRPIEPYIPAKVQIIAANGLLYISTARGLYALDAETGAERWVYATEMPLGHSPTVFNDVAYVGGLDHQLHAVDALSGARLWTFEAGAGFDTNPLVVNGLVYAGNRDGYMYAIYAHENPLRGTLAWKYQTGGPIHFSAAYQDGIVYFASNDAYAYALDATTGALVWKSAKLPAGDGFHSWWPVVNGNHVIFSAAVTGTYPPQTGWSSTFYTKGDSPLFDAACAVSNSAPLGPVLPDGSMDFSSALQYLEGRPWRRSYYLLNAATGQEVTYDFDHDGLPTYAPLLNTGTNSGTRYPASSAPMGYSTPSTITPVTMGMSPAGKQGLHPSPFPVPGSPPRMNHSLTRRAAM